MDLRGPNVDIFIPDGAPLEEALARTTHMAIGAHQDDIEIMAYHGILESFATEGDWFLAVVVTDGAGSPREDHYAAFTDEQMKKVRVHEQRKAAYVGEYSAVIQLAYPSGAAKDGANSATVEDLHDLLRAASPRVVYTHSLTDKHDTHVSVALRAITALRALPEERRPDAVYGCEVWRDLDWMADADKVALEVAAHENLAMSLVGVFDSQISGGKRYDLATMGRRRAHATYHASHGVDKTTGLTFAMDLTPLIETPDLSPEAHTRAHVLRFLDEVCSRVRRHDTAPRPADTPARREWKRPLVRSRHRADA